MDQGISESASPRERAPVWIILLGVGTIIWTLVTLLGLLLPDGTAVFGVDGDAPPPDLWIVATEAVMALAKTVGAILMFSMRKSGFYIYTLSEVVCALLNLLYGLTLYAWAERVSGPAAPVDPALMVIIMIGLQTALSMIWVGGYAVHLGRMR